MTEPIMNTPRFNALTDAWLPLVKGDGSTTWASPVEVLCGEKDGVDVDYPRDDFRVYARLLLSALVQALLPAKNSKELVQRIDVPMTRAEIDARIEPIIGDFDLFGPKPFLQVVPPIKPPDKGAAPFVFGGEDIYQPATQIDAIAVPIALVALFIEQTYAGGAGRGYGAGPGGQPGALTLIDPGSIRQGAWANTLTLEAVQGRYASERDGGWSNESRAAAPRSSIGIVGGLFFQPRSIWLIALGEGTCSFSGLNGPLVRFSPFQPKSKLAEKASGGEDIWQHPCAPLAVNSQGIAAIRLSAERPAWTGLAQLLDPVANAKNKVAHKLEGPAPVLKQWTSLSSKTKRPRLLVLDFDRDKANVKRRFFESYPLTQDLLGSQEAREKLRALVKDAEGVERSLHYALTRAHDDRKAGGLALADARSSFWSASESPFLDWLDSISENDDETEEGDERTALAESHMRAQLRKTALAIFNAHAAISEFDPRKQELVAKARLRLRGELFPNPHVPKINRASLGGEP